MALAFKLGGLAIKIKLGRYPTYYIIHARYYTMQPRVATIDKVIYGATSKNVQK